MSAIITLSPGAKLPAYMQNRKALAVINDDVASGSSFPTLSIKGKVFTLVKGSEKKLLTKTDDEGEITPVQSLMLAAVRANTKSRVFYLKQYVEGDEGVAARPDCYSYDGIAPGHDAVTPQAKKCAACPHAVWGSKANSDNKGTACTVNTRLAVVDPTQVMAGDQIEPYLLRVPAGSRTNFAEVVKTAQSRGIPYNALALKVSFDPTAPSPKLVFKIAGLADDATYDRINKAYESDLVKEMVGLLAPREELPAPAASEDDDALDAALAARAAAAEKPPTKTAVAKETTAAVIARVSQAQPPAEPADDEAADPLAGLGDLVDTVEAEAAAAPAPAPKPAPKPRKAAAPATATPAPPPAAPAPASDPSELLAGLDDLLGGMDD